MTNRIVKCVAMVLAGVVLVPAGVAALFAFGAGGVWLLAQPLLAMGVDWRVAGYFSILGLIGGIIGATYAYERLFGRAA